MLELCTAILLPLPHTIPKQGDAADEAEAPRAAPPLPLRRPPRLRSARRPRRRRWRHALRGAPATGRGTPPSQIRHA
jgi:hypothetical protein